MSDLQESTVRSKVKRPGPVQSHKLTAARLAPAYVVMHEVNAAICLAGGILAPRSEASAARDHHVRAGCLQFELNAPSERVFKKAMGDLSYGSVVIFEVNYPTAGHLLPPSMPIMHAMRLVFSSQEELQLFRARMSGYGDVPNDILPMEVDVSLFTAQDVTTPMFSAGILSEPDETTKESNDDVLTVKVESSRVFRDIDRCAGGLLGALSTVKATPDASRVLVSLGAIALGTPDEHPVEQFASTISLAVVPAQDSDIFGPVLKAAVSVLSAGSMEDGFSARAFIQEAESLSYKSLEETSPQYQVIHKFWTFTKDVVELRRDVPEGAWSDDGGSALARGLLLFVLNPESVQLHALRERIPKLGNGVYFIAALLIGIRSGLTRMGLEVKAAREPFLAGAAFAHDWFCGSAPLLSIQRKWDAVDGACISSLMYGGLAMGSEKEPSNSLLSQVAAALRKASVETRFLPDTGDLVGKLAADIPESLFGVYDIQLPAFPRQAAWEFYTEIPTKLSDKALMTLLSDINAGNFDHCVFARTRKDRSGRILIQLSVLLMRASETESIENAIEALAVFTRTVISLTQVKPPRRALSSTVS